MISSPDCHNDFILRKLYCSQLTCNNSLAMATLYDSVEFFLTIPLAILQFVVDQKRETLAEYVPQPK